MYFYDEVSSPYLCPLVHSNWSIPCWFFYINMNIFGFFLSTTASYSSKYSLSIFPAPLHISTTGIGLSISLKLEFPTVVAHNYLRPILLISVRMCFLVYYSFIPSTCLKSCCCFPVLVLVQLRCRYFSWCLLIWRFSWFSILRTLLVHFWLPNEDPLSHGYLPRAPIFIQPHVCHPQCRDKWSSFLLVISMCLFVT